MKYFLRLLLVEGYTKKLNIVEAMKLGTVHTIESIIIANKIKPAKTMSSLS